MKPMLCLYAAVNSLFLWKYVSRVSQTLALLVIVVYLLFLLVSCFFVEKIREKFSPPSKRWIMGGVLVAILVLVLIQVSIDPYSLKIDRWSAIHNFIGNLFQGVYPYAAQTHLGGYGSPFPVWQLLHIPFYLLGDVALSVFVAMFLFLYGITLAGGVKAVCLAFPLLLFSPSFLYEVIAWSDLMTNFMLVCAIICLLCHYRVSFSDHWMMIAIVCGLLMSTRLSAVIPFGVYYLKEYVQASGRARLLFPLLVVFVFAVTFLPFLIWDGEMLLFFEYNPFVLQSRQGNTSDILLLIPVGVWLSLSWKGEKSLYMGHTAWLLVVLVVITFTHNMYVRGDWNQLFESTYDITYFNVSSI